MCLVIEVLMVDANTGVFQALSKAFAVVSERIFFGCDQERSRESL